MPCIYYQNDTLHTLSDEAQQEHLKTCIHCRQRSDFEEKIIQEAGQLNRLYPDNRLWPEIENNLQQNTSRNKSLIMTVKSYSRFWLSAAALIFALISFSLFYIFSGGSEKILSDGALIRVEFTEQNYIKAIRDLEKEAGPKMASLDTEIMLLYRDKLETIDRQINHCRKAIENNPGNAHIRRYMLTALQDKKETLREILEI